MPGGAIALSYAVRHPEQVSHLILFDNYSRGDLVDGTPLKRKKETKALTSMIEAGWGRDDTDVFRRIFSGLLMPEGSEKEHKWLAELQRKTTTPAMAAQLWEAYNRIDVEGLAKKVDKVIPFEAGRTLASLISGAWFVPLEGENHILLNDDPAWGRFLAEVRSFVGNSETEPTPDEPKSVFPELTARKLEVLDLISRGLKNSEIAAASFTSARKRYAIISHAYSVNYGSIRGERLSYWAERLDWVKHKQSRCNLTQDHSGR